VAHTWANHRLTRGKIQLVFKAPRGPVMGCHVALHHWFIGYGLYVKFGMPPGVEPATSRAGERTMIAGLATVPRGGVYELFGIKYI
jgi:hypothetical protein